MEKNENAQQDCFNSSQIHLILYGVIHEYTYKYMLVYIHIFFCLFVSWQIRDAIWFCNKRTQHSLDQFMVDF